MIFSPSALVLYPDVDPAEISDDLDGEQEAHNPQAWELLAEERLGNWSSSSSSEATAGIQELATGVTPKTIQSYQRHAPLLSHPSGCPTH